MGLLSRFKGIISANTNNDSAKMVDEYLMEAMEDFEESKKDLDILEVEESRYKRILDKANEGVQKYAELAKRAVQAGNEDDARVFIEKKQLIESKIEAVKKVYEQVHANTDKMREMHNKIAADIETLKGLKVQMGAAAAGTETQKEASNAVAGAALAGYARMEEKPQGAPDAASATAELNAVPSSPAKDIEKTQVNGAKSSIEDELSQLKSELRG